MKKICLGAAICLLASVALFLLYNSTQTAPPPIEPSVTNHAFAPIIPTVKSNSPTQESAAATQQHDLASPQGNESAANAAAPVNLPPEIILQNIRRAIHQFGEMFGGNPVGTNPEITAALAGKNPKQINFLSGQPGIRINENGEMIDSWGTPYFFHQLSGAVMEIHSAGPDKILWTSDDLVTK